MEVYMKIQSESDPIGAVQKTIKFEEKIIALSNDWDEKIKTISKKWWSVNKTRISLATIFLLNSLDELIIFANEVVKSSGADKKATVLDGIDKLYDYVALEAFPIWLRPFATVIKQYVIYTLISSFVDYIVEKYKDGSWNKTGG